MADPVLLAEYEQLFRNIMAHFSGNLDADGIMHSVKCEALFEQKPELKQVFEDALGKVSPGFADSIRKYLKGSTD